MEVSVNEKIIFSDQKNELKRRDIVPLNKKPSFRTIVLPLLCISISIRGSSAMV